jgi:hypothetical protein
MASCSKKRKHTFLTIETKLEILKKLSKGESGASLAKFYGVGTSTISDIKAKKDGIEKFALKMDSEEGSQTRKTVRLANNAELEDAMYIWFTQRRSLGEPISGPMLCEKALQFNKSLEGPADFKASAGWLNNFKKRHGIRELEIQGEKLSSDHVAAQTFKQKFIDMVTENQYTRDDIYNADETGVLWRSLPRKSLASRREMSAPGFKVSKERVTALVCANASGSHALKLLVIGKSKSPRCFKNVKTLPVIYNSQKNSWMTAYIFENWYKNEFIPSVKKYREENNKTGKVLLIIDNAPTHPSHELLNAIEKDFVVQFLPPNVTAILQPMDQAIIEKMKRIYRKQLLRRLLLAERDEDSVISFIKKINIKDGVYMLADAWSSLTKDNLKNGWNNLCPEEKENEGGNCVVNKENDEVEEITSLFNEIPGFEQCETSDAREWLETDANDQGFQILNDQEITDTVKESKVCDESDEEENDYASIDEGPSHAEAFKALETAMSWLEKQPESTPTQLVLLKRIRDMAAKKRNSSCVQKTIKDFFKT